jgi:hypothetical protein
VEYVVGHEVGGDVGLPALLGERRLVDGAAVLALEQRVDAAEQLQVEVELLLVQPDGRPGEHPLDRSREPEQEAEAPSQQLYAHLRTAHVRKVRPGVRRFSAARRARLDESTNRAYLSAPTPSPS